MRPGWIVGAAVAASMAAAIAARADEAYGANYGLHDPTYLVIGAGSWEVARGNLSTGEADLTLRPAHHWWLLKPELGLVVAGDGDVLAFAGPLFEYYLTPALVGTVSTSVGTWAGGGFNLGSRVEFHSGAELAWRFADESRLGFGFYHTSNADLTKRNPGSESALLEYSLPIRIGP